MNKFEVKRVIEGYFFVEAENEESACEIVKKDFANATGSHASTSYKVRRIIETPTKTFTDS
jgi:hypothetical protein